MALLDTMRTPTMAEGDAIMPSENTDGSWVVWDAEWDEEIGDPIIGPGAERVAKANAIDAMIERGYDFDGYDGTDPFSGDNDPILRDANGVPL